jgi:hypothetical protein
MMEVQTKYGKIHVRPMDFDTIYIEFNDLKIFRVKYCGSFRTIFRDDFWKKKKTFNKSKAHLYIKWLWSFDIKKLNSPSRRRSIANSSGSAANIKIRELIIEILDDLDHTSHTLFRKELYSAGFLKSQKERLALESNITKKTKELHHLQIQRRNLLRNESKALDMMKILLD